MKPLAVLLPTYNSAHYLQCSIDSVLAQSFKDFDLYIYDDCSTDSTEAIVKAYSDKRVIYKRNNENLGIAKTLNRGLEETLTQYQYVARMDADDWCYPERFKKQIDFLEQHPNIGMCGTQGYWVKTIDELPKLTWTYPLQHDIIKINLLFAASFGHSSVMFKSNLLPLNFRYNPNVKTCEDWDLWIRLIKVIKVANLPDFLMQYRIVSGSNHRHEEHKILHLKERSKILSNYWQEFGISINTAQVYTYFYDAHQQNGLDFRKGLRHLIGIYNTLDKISIKTLDAYWQSYFRYKFLRIISDFWKRSSVSRKSLQVWLIIFKNVKFSNPLTIVKGMIR